MPLFTYKAVNPEGRMLFGRIDALNLVDLEMRLKRMELDLVSGEPVSTRSFFAGGAIPRRE
ncbi:MAG TPA: type II secretion system F family protein, partial [Accumulibacter sp.]|nr:type II secretion system F family protein [Accumulibacter sp.]